MSDDQQLFAAFMAGFLSAGEGHNSDVLHGQYVDSDGGPSSLFIEEMREDFQKWRANPVWNWRK